MQLPFVRLLRRLLICIIALVCLAVLVNYTQTSRQRRAMVKPAAQILSPEMMRSAVNIEHFANSGGGTKFRLRAEKLLENRDGKETLQGIHANDYDRDGNELNHLTCDKLEYDTNGKKLYFYGNVYLRLGKGVELRMNTLHYDLKEQIYFTEDTVQFASARANGTVRGMRYDNGKKHLEALHDLAFVVHQVSNDSGSAKGNKDYQLFSNEGSFSESENQVILNGAARIVSASGALSGDRITGLFTPDGKHLTSLVCEGNAVYDATDGTGSRKLLGQRMDFGINQSTQGIESIAVHEGASFVTRTADEEQKLDASEIQLQLDPVKGAPEVIRSQNGVRFSAMREGQGTTLGGDWLEARFNGSGGALEDMHVRDNATMKMNGSGTATDELAAQDIRISFRDLNGRSVPRVLLANGSVVWKTAGSAGAGAANEGRSLSASSLTMNYAASGESLESGNATGGVVLSALPTAAADSSSVQRMDCDRATFDFFTGNNRLKTLAADGHVKVFYHRAGRPGTRAPADEFQTSSTSLQAHFREKDGATETVSQSGNFTYQDGTRSATSGNCEFNAVTNRMVMREHPSVVDQNSTTGGDVLEYDRDQKRLTVEGHVRSILRAAKGTSAGFLTSSTDASSPGVITADEMLYWPDSTKVQYSGKVQLLSASGQLQAQELTIYNSGERVEAERDVRHLVFAGAASGTRAKSSQRKGGSPTLIRSASLQYSRSDNRVHYEGTVVLEASEGAKVQADRLDGFLDAAGKRIDYATATGNVRVTQPGREAKGTSAEYFMAEGRFVLTGDPAEMRDLAKGTSYARRLTFVTSDDRIVLDNR